jgi:uncharacterized protein
MNVLAQIVSSRVRAEIFTLLFGQEQELHVRELARRASLGVGTVQQDLRNLLRLDLVRARRDGNRLYYRANSDHVLYPDIRGLVVKTSGLVPLIRDALSGQNIDCAFIYGSVAREQATGSSDIDLMVIGKVGLRKLAGLLSSAVEGSGREINPYVLTPEELRKRTLARDHFLTQVLGEPKIFIVGGQRELDAMGKLRLA